MTEVRTTSSTGGQKGVKAERFSLMPRAGLAAIARVFGFGATKYADHNWRLGYEWSKSFDALERHFQAAKDGETYDEESGLPHLAHAGFHILVLLTWLEEQGEGVDNPFDDRWPHAMARPSRPTPEVRDLRPLQDSVDRMVRNLIFATGDENAEAAGFKVVWRDPEVPTLDATNRWLLEEPVRFVAGFDGTADLEDRDYGPGPDLLSKRKPIYWVNDLLNRR